MPSPTLQLSRARRRLRTLGVAGLAGGLLAVGLTAVSATGAGDAEVRLVFNQRRGEMTAVANLGSANTRQRILHRNGGRIMIRDSFGGERNSAGFPANDPSRAGARAALALTNAGTADEMEPGARTFTFGAHVRLGKVTGTSEFDNGNNVLQRGLHDDGSQFKVEIERGTATCRVKGHAGALQVSSPVPIRSFRWYGVFCTRVAKAPVGEVRFTVTPISDTGRRGKSRTVIKKGRTGRVLFPVRTPLSVGAKVNADLHIEEASDQFNGRIDNAYLRIR